MTDVQILSVLASLTCIGSIGATWSLAKAVRRIEKLEVEVAHLRRGLDVESQTKGFMSSDQAQRWKEAFSSPTTAPPFQVHDPVYLTEVSPEWDRTATLAKGGEGAA